MEAQNFENWIQQENEKEELELHIKFKDNLDNIANNEYQILLELMVKRLNHVVDKTYINYINGIDAYNTMQKIVERQTSLEKVISRLTLIVEQFVEINKGK